MNHVKSIIPMLLVVALLVLFNSCNEDSVNQISPQSTTIVLRNITTDYTSINLKLSISSNDDKSIFSVKRNGIQIYSGKLIGNDTLIMDKYLTPSSEYRYVAIKLINGIVIDSSDALIVRTKDTSSCTYIWNEYEFGDQPSNLKDVLVINPNDVWAVGSVYIYDSPESVS